MKPSILRTNATPVYRFLSRIHAELSDGETLRDKRILDCGAGGRVPPLAIFAEQGMQTFGIDLSERQLDAARAYTEKRKLEIGLQQADMRKIPFPNASFDYVYEHYSMCHLSKADTARAIAEMLRVLKAGGTAFFGVISSESWPASSFGEERTPGEHWMTEGGEETLHSIFSDAEADHLVSDWEITAKERAVIHTNAADISEQAWADLHQEAPVRCSAEAWTAQYERRANYFRYVHTYYYLRKTA